MHAAESSDATLVAESLAGNKEAFRRIVERYQTLISSLAYSATGNVSRSEDLAQETFVRAWTQLSRLREPAKLRPWLCSITRFLIHKEYRRQGREPVHRAEPLDEIDQWESPDPEPRDLAMSKEEQALLWRSLERIPEVYREPLILYYREQRSVATVAQDLDLSEDAVKQRLSRGRKLLQQQLLGFIEGALERTRPRHAFTLAVLASLPALTFSAQAAAAGAVAKGGASTVKAAGGAGLLAVLLGPMIVFLPNYLAYRLSLAGAYSEEERDAIRSLYARVAAITLGLYIPLSALLIWATWGRVEASHLSGLLAGALVIIFLPVFCILMMRMSRKDPNYLARVLEEEHQGEFPKPGFEYRSELTLLGLPLVHIRFGDRFAPMKKPVKAWVAAGHTAMGGLFAFGAASIAPISVGGLSVGLLSFGGLALGGVCIGGVSIGVWPIFGALLIGWQAFNGCFSIGWDSATGLFAAAREYAAGRFAYAAQANTDLALETLRENPMFHWARFTSRHWLWLNLLWILPFLAMWRMARKRKPQPECA